MLSGVAWRETILKPHNAIPNKGQEQAEDSLRDGGKYHFNPKRYACLAAFGACPHQFSDRSRRVSGREACNVTLYPCVPPTLWTPVDTCLGNKSSFKPPCVTGENESILIGVGPALGLGLLGVRPPGSLDVDQGGLGNTSLL